MKIKLLLYPILNPFFLFLVAMAMFIPVARAQSTGDTLPSRTVTPHQGEPASATFTPVVAVPTVWVARLSNTPGFTTGSGSIVRVQVQGMLDAAIELRSGDQLITGRSGSKPEYGTYAAEFAPVTKGTWLVTVPAIGVNMSVEADNYNLAEIEFVQVPATQATQTVTPSATPLGGVDWEAVVVSEEGGKSVPYARLLVQVRGRDGQPVQLSTVSQIINTATTGQKPGELGPHTVEFTGLTPGNYFVEPLGLNISHAVTLKPNVETRIEFRPISVSPTATANLTPLPTQPTPVATTPPVPSATPSATSSATPTEVATLPPATEAQASQPTPTPVTRWIGAVESRSIITGASVIEVKVSGIEGLPVRLANNDNGAEPRRRCITGQQGQGQDVCVFEALEPGFYTITPEGSNVNLPLRLSEYEVAQVRFDVDTLPPGVVGWSARINHDSNGYAALPKTEALIRVKVVGKSGQVVAIQSMRLSTVDYCEVVNNPVLGDLYCEFDRLGPGVYRIEALHTGAVQNLFVDGVGSAEVEFLPDATTASQTFAQQPPLVGLGAALQPPPTATVTATAIPTRAATQPLPTWTPTPTPTSLPTQTPTPAFAWQGRIVETSQTGAGAIGVRAAGLKDHPVIIHSGAWQTPPQLTGNKPELGDFATEFGGLAQGEYVIELVDLAEMKVFLEGGQFMLVEFRYEFVPSP